MSVTAVKYNPGFLTDDQLAESFCVRRNELESIVETLRECTGASNPHMMVIGPRGSGKTTLLLRTAIKVRRDDELSSCLFPIVFPEESYEIGTCGEFWLECLSRLAEQAPQREGGPDLRRSRDCLRSERDDQTLSTLCLGALLDFADREDKRLVLLVENMNMILASMADAHDAWRLRQVFQTEPRIILLASATGRFMQIDEPSEAFYGFFRIIALRPLRTGECAALWETVSGQPPGPESVRSIEILTGGNPRLVMIVARFSARSSLSELMNNLLGLIDDHTEYFKSHLDALPAQERRVYLALAELWKPATTREVADRARLDTSKCSAQLQRLSERGIVQTAGGSARRKQYYVTERLYNIYYLLRKGRGGLDRMVEALIGFMVSFYSPNQARDMVARMSQEKSDGSLLYGAAQKYIAPMIGLRDTFLAKIKETEIGLFSKDGEAVSRETGSLMGLNDSENVAVVASRISDTIDKGNAFLDSEEFSEALEIYDGVIDEFDETDAPEIAPQIARAFVNKGFTLTALHRPEEALSVLDETIRRFGQTDYPAVAGAFMNKGAALIAAGRPEEALSVLDETVERFGGNENPIVVQALARALAARGVAFNDLNRPDEALNAFDETIRVFGASKEPRAASTIALALTMKSSTAITMKPEAALAMLEDIIKQFGTNDDSLVFRAVAHAFTVRGSVHLAMNRPEEGLKDFDEAIARTKNEREPFVVEALTMKSVALMAMERPEEALQTSEEAVDLLSGDSDNALFLALALTAKGLAQAATDQTEEGLSILDQAAAKTVEEPFGVFVGVSKALALTLSGRPEDALIILDETVASLKIQESSDAMLLVAWALEVKGVALIGLDRSKEAQSAFRQAVQMIDGCEETHSQNCFSRALRERIPPLILEGAEFQLKNRRYDAAVNLATVALESANSSIRIKGHGVRAIARCEIGDQASWAHDITDMLALLPKIDPLPADCIGALGYLSVRGDAATVIDLVEASPSAELLLPLVTALRRGLGQEPRVAREVAEVAEDIQRELSTWRRKLSQADAAGS